MEQSSPQWGRVLLTGILGTRTKISRVGSETSLSGRSSPRRRPSIVSPVVGVDYTVAGGHQPLGRFARATGNAGVIPKDRSARLSGRRRRTYALASVRPNRPYTFRVGNIHEDSAPGCKRRNQIDQSNEQCGQEKDRYHQLRRRTHTRENEASQIKPRMSTKAFKLNNYMMPQV